MQSDIQHLKMILAILCITCICIIGVVLLYVDIAHGWGKLSMPLLNSQKFNKWRTRLQWSHLALATLAVFTVSGLMVYLPQYQAGLLKKQVGNVGQLKDSDRIQLEKDAVDFANKSRTTIAQIIGGIGLLAGLYFTWRTVRTTEEGKLTERYSKAIELLSNKDNVTVQIGAIYALERIARDSQKDHWTIMEVLTSFIRKHAEETKSAGFMGKSSEVEKNSTPYSDISLEVQAALTVIRRRKWARCEDKENRDRLALRDTYLPTALLNHADLEYAYFQRARLENAHFWKAKLGRANFEDAHLEYAELSEADLKEAIFKGAYLTGTNFSKVKNLNWEQLKVANFDAGKPIHLLPCLEAKWDKEKERHDKAKQAE